MEEFVKNATPETEKNFSGEDKKNKGMLQNKRKRLIFYLIFMIFPVAHFVFFYVYVNISNIMLAFQSFDITPNGYKGSFVWFDNFKFIIDMLGKGNNISMVTNSLIMYALKLFVVMVLAILFSYYIYKEFLFSKFFKVMLFLPRVISSVVMVLLFKYIVEDVYVALSGAQYGLLTSHGLPTVLFYNIWVGFGTDILMYSGAMSGINESISESAQLDGANIVKEFWYITLPMIFPTVITFLVVGISSIFTEQMGLYTFFDEGAPMKTVGYYLFVQAKISDLVAPDINTLSYPQISAFGLMITAIILPTSLTVKHLLEKYGPSAD